MSPFPSSSLKQQLVCLLSKKYKTNITAEIAVLKHIHVPDNGFPKALIEIILTVNLMHFLADFGYGF